ncbi:hypothetical protein BHE74_00013089 [Ensete ventricosum]|nr:hypothetical protein GW17_00002342 [Ensete ventricosum]RWW78681.1 hypothetical protein BHE74_00013089 [Ensete ventricosum]
MHREARAVWSFPPSALGSHGGGSSSSSSSSSCSCHRHPVLEAGGLPPKEGEEGGGGREQSPTWFTWDHMHHTHRSPSPSPSPTQALRHVLHLTAQAFECCGKPAKLAYSDMTTW